MVVVIIIQITYIDNKDHDSCKEFDDVNTVNSYRPYSLQKEVKRNEQKNWESFIYVVPTQSRRNLGRLKSGQHNPITEERTLSCERKLQTS